VQNQNLLTPASARAGSIDESQVEDTEKPGTLDGTVHTASESKLDLGSSVGDLTVETPGGSPDPEAMEKINQRLDKMQKQIEKLKKNALKHKQSLHSSEQRTPNLAPRLQPSESQEHSAPRSKDSHQVSHKVLTHPLSIDRHTRSKKSGVSFLKKAEEAAETTVNENTQREIENLKKELEAKHKGLDSNIQRL
jgi:exonuclease VII large subunit